MAIFQILSVLDAFEVGDSLYTVTDMMDGRLADIVDEHLNHFVIAKIVYQLLSALEPLHSNGLYHGVSMFWCWVTGLGILHE